MKFKIDDTTIKVRLIPIFLAIVLIGGFGLGYKYIFGTANKDVDRKIFKASNSYIEGMVDDLAKYKYELITEEDTTARKSIINLIVDRYSDFDEDKMENESLKEFLVDIRNGNIK